MPADVSSRKLRLFVALEIPEAVRAGIQKAQDELRHKFASSGIRWANPTQFHLTLKFLGDIESTHLDTLSYDLQTACSRFSQFRLTAEKAGIFPNPHKPRVLWIGLSEESGELVRLQSEIESTTAYFTNEQRDEKFTAHVTIGRIKAIGASEAVVLRQLMERVSGRVFGTWTASRIQLVRSELGGNGARHTVVAELPFKFT